MDPPRRGDSRSVPDSLIVFLIGVAAGALNSLGGGGTFIALPALVAIGMPPVTANAVSRIALVPGALAGIWVYRREIAPIGAVSVWALTAVSVVGSIVGAVLLLALPAASFAAASPWLLAFSTVVLAFGGRLSRLITRLAGRPVVMSARWVLVGQFLIAIYGGYFGGAVGILMVALWAVGLGLSVSAANPMRIVQLAAVFSVAGVVFLFRSDALDDPLRLVVLTIGAIAGGYGGAHVARRLPPRVLRWILLGTATVMTVLYFIRG